MQFCCRFSGFWCASAINHRAPMDKAPQGFLEHNETQVGLAGALNATGTYVSDTVQGKKS